MIWVVSLIIALVAYFLFQGLHARHISRCHTDNRTAEHVSDAMGMSKAHTEFHEKSKATAAQTQRQRGPAQNAPSLLYADRPNAARSQLRNDNLYASQNQPGRTPEAANQSSSTNNRELDFSANDNIDLELDSNATVDNTLETMDFTAEHTPMSESDVGIPANNSEYAVANTAQNTAQNNSTNSAIAAAGAGVAAATAGVAAAASGHLATDHVTNEVSENVASETALNENEDAAHAVAENTSTGGSGTTENIDLELGDSDNTYNDAEDMDGNNHDELLDFGDLTSDISDMLKELNLRESDSPRLEINEAEFEQLKTGEPGEVKPAKIENVADKLRNMLQ